MLTTLCLATLVDSVTLPGTRCPLLGTFCVPWFVLTAFFLFLSRSPRGLIVSFPGQAYLIWDLSRKNVSSLKACETVRRLHELLHRALPANDST